MPHHATIPEIDAVAGELCSPASLDTVYHNTLHDAPMPSLESLKEIMSRLKAALFPGYFGMSHVHPESMRYHLSANLDSIYRLLAEQIRRGACFACAAFAQDCEACGEAASGWNPARMRGASGGTAPRLETAARDPFERAMALVRKLPHIRRLLASDARAAYEGDPAANSPGETIFCYPSLLAMTHHRIAHELYALNVPIIPRIIAEMAHSHTGIDIHPGAQIGEEFFIDHGTGVVIGETAIIGKQVRIYQAVTLGAKRFTSDETGQLHKGEPRHPIVEDEVVIYAGATILGRVTIGKGSTIGGNVWLTRSVPPGSQVSQASLQHDESRCGKD
jgi:serine O-acetyltransferase